MFSTCIWANIIPFLAELSVQQGVLIYGYVVYYLDKQKRRRRRGRERREEHRILARHFQRKDSASRSVSCLLFSKFGQWVPPYSSGRTDLIPHLLLLVWPGGGEEVVVARRRWVVEYELFLVHHLTGMSAGLRVCSIIWCKSSGVQRTEEVLEPKHKEGWKANKDWTRLHSCATLYCYNRWG